MSEQDKEKARMAIEDAVYRALEAGMSKADIEAEVAYAVESAADQ